MVKYPGDSIIESITFEQGDPENDEYEKITYKNCEKCNLPKCTENFQLGIKTQQCINCFYKDSKQKNN